MVATNIAPTSTSSSEDRSLSKQSLDVAIFCSTQKIEAIKYFSQCRLSVQARGCRCSLAFCRVDSDLSLVGSVCEALKEEDGI